MEIKNSHESPLVPQPEAEGLQTAQPYDEGFDALFEAPQKKSSFPMNKISFPQNNAQYQTMVATQATGTRGRNWCQRTFCGYQNETLRSAIMTLLNTAKGVGCLSIPLAYTYVGMIPGTIILLLASISIGYTFYLMNRVQVRNKDCNIYTDLVKKIIGPKNQMFMSIIFWIYLFGAMVGFNLCAHDFFMNCFGEKIGALAGLTHAQYNNPHDNNVYWFKKILSLCYMWGACLVIFPLAWPDIAGNFLRYSYAFPVVALLYILFLMIGEAPDYISTQHNEVEIFTGS